MKEKQEHKVRKIKDWDLKGSDKVKAIIQNDTYADITRTAKKGCSVIKKINKFEYVNTRTGEIKKYDLKENKESVESLKRSFKNLVHLIRHNFTAGSENQLFVTLTYAENMTDKDRLYKDFEKFFKKLKRRYKGIKFDYILVAEPQERGAWHVHLMLKGNKPLYIHDAVIRELWGLGITQTERLKSDDVGTYYVSYFTNLELEAKNNKTENKRYIKGARLHFYPSGMKLYRTTRGIKKPVEIEKSFDDVKKEFGEPVWKQEYEILKTKNGSEEVINKIYKASFKK